VSLRTANIKRTANVVITEVNLGLRLSFRWDKLTKLDVDLLACDIPTVVHSITQDQAAAIDLAFENEDTLASLAPLQYPPRYSPNRRNVFAFWARDTSRLSTFRKARELEQNCKDLYNDYFQSFPGEQANVVQKDGLGYPQPYELMDDVAFLCTSFDIALCYVKVGPSSPHPIIGSDLMELIATACGYSPLHVSMLVEHLMASRPTRITRSKRNNHVLTSQWSMLFV
jgi:hypothetical protein